MPIPFSTIPKHIQLSIVQKQDLNDFVKFQQCSRKSFSLAKSVKTRFSFFWCGDDNHIQIEQRNEGGYCLIFISYDRESSSYITKHIFDKERMRQCPIRFVIGINIVEKVLTTELCEWILNFALFTYSTVEYLVMESADCSPDIFNNLLITLNITRLMSDGPISEDYFRLPAMKQMNDLDVNNCYLNDVDISYLKIKELVVEGTYISSFGINVIIKEWLLGKREIESIKIGTYQQLRIGTVLDGLHYSVSNIGEKNVYRIRNEKGEKIQIRFNQDFMVCLDRIKAT